MRIMRVTALALAVTAATVGIGACSSHNGSSGDSADRAINGAAAPGRPPVVHSAPAASPTANAAGGGAMRASLDDVQLGTAKIRTAQMTVTIKHGVPVSTQADDAETIALQAGGEVDADDRTSGPFAGATLVLRVPPERLGAVLDQLSRLGVEKSRHLSTEDVTSKVADVNSRVTSARLEIARLRDLYERATKISDVITVESELAQRESDLESLEAQQRALAAQTATAAITLTLTSTPKPAPPKPAPKHHRSGFVGGLQNGWDAFARGAGALAVAAGAILPFALLALVLIALGRLVWPRLRRTPAASPPQ